MYRPGPIDFRQGGTGPDRSLWAISSFAMDEVLEENKGVRVRYTGSDNFQRGDYAIVSFPGVHGRAWTRLTQPNLQFFKTSCVFLPDKTADGFGDHVPDPDCKGKCYCWRLYEGKKDFGCKWFDLWMKKTEEAIQAGCKILVVEKARGGLGDSQAGEVQFLKDQRVKFDTVNLRELLPGLCF